MSIFRIISNNLLRKGYKLMKIINADSKEQATMHWA
jgi:hypothetical protein